MSFSTLVTVKRSGTTIATHVPLRFINISPQVAAQMGGASPFNSYWVESEVLGLAPDVRQGDQLQDEVNTDPKTGNLTLYTVNGNPWPADKTALKVQVEKLVGKVPA